MRIHIQGIALLGAVFLVLLGIANWAAPVVNEAFSSEGAIQATSSPEPPIGSEEEAEDLPLNTEEIAQLQTLLESINYDMGGIDGIIGPKTREAINQAKLDLATSGLGSTSSDRRLLDRLIVLTESN